MGYAGRQGGGIRRCAFRRGCPRPSWRSPAQSCRPCRRRGAANRDRRGKPSIARMSAPRSAWWLMMSALRRYDPAHAAGGPEFARHHAHRDARAATLAGRPVGDRLAAAEAAVGEDVVQLARAFADQVCKNLALLLAREIRAGRWRGQIELRRIAPMLGHGRWFGGYRRPRLASAPTQHRPAGARRQRQMRAVPNTLSRACLSAFGNRPLGNCRDRRCFDVPRQPQAFQRAKAVRCWRLLSAAATNVRRQVRVLRGVVGRVASH